MPTLTLPKCCSPGAITVHLCRGALPSVLTLEGFLAREAELVQALTKASTEPSKQLLSELFGLLQDIVPTDTGKQHLVIKSQGALKRFAKTILEAAPTIASQHQANMANQALRDGTAEWFPSQKRLVRKDLLPEDAYRMDFFQRSNAMFMGAYVDETLAKRIKSNILGAYATALGDVDPKLTGSDRDSWLKNKISRELTEKFKSVSGATENYWKVYSTNALNNARTYASLKLFSQQEGVVGYRIRAVIDSQTSNICRALDGKTFQIQQALARFDQFFSASSLEQIKAISPMVHGASESGFYYQSGGSNTAVEVKDYSGLLAAGITFPPFHFNCRSTIEPVYGMFDWEQINGYRFQDETGQTRGLNEIELEQLREMEKAKNAQEFLWAVGDGYKPFEVAYILASDNTFFLHSSYLQNETNYSKYQLEKMIGADVYHTHPVNSPLSNDDIGVGLTNSTNSINAVAASIGGSIVYKMGPMNKAKHKLNPDLDIAEQIASLRMPDNKNLETLYQELKESVRNGIISDIEAGDMYINASNYKIALEWGITYGSYQVQSGN